MTAAMNHPLVSYYLARLEAAAAGGQLSDAEVLTTLDRLGVPEELVAEAGYAAAPPVTRAAALVAGPPRTSTREVAALVLFALTGILTISLIGAPIAVLTWIPAVVLLLVSSVWSAREKLAGGLVLGLAGSPLLLIGAGLTPVLLFPAGRCTAGPTKIDLITGAVIQGGEECTGGPPAWLPWATGVVALALVALWLVTWFRLWRSARSGG